jgi:hypothetical protein
LGQYSIRNRRIQISTDAQSDRMVQRVLTHELCHALGFQQGLDLDDERMWGGSWENYPERFWAHESFAHTCEVGPLTSHVIGDVCPEDERDSNAFQFVRDLYVVPDPGFLESEPRWLQVASLDVESVARLLDVRTTNNDSIRLEYVDSTGISQVHHVDPFTGDLAPMSLIEEVSSDLGKPPGHTVSQGSATVGDVTLARIRFTAGNGAQLTRMVVETPSGFARAGCARTDELPFATQDALWSVHLDDGVIRWGTWEDLPIAIR